jgi:hypothetical protein
MPDSATLALSPVTLLIVEVICDTLHFSAVPIVPFVWIPFSLFYMPVAAEPQNSAYMSPLWLRCPFLYAWFGSHGSNGRAPA